MTLDEFRELIKSLEGNMPMDKVISLFNEALDSTENMVEPELDENGEETGDNGDKMSPEAFVEMIIRNRVGGYGNEVIDFSYLL